MDDLTILVTGSTGSFGKRFVATLLRDYQPKKVINFSRDELKQHEMRQQLPDGIGSPVRYFIGDVRDVDRLRRAMSGVDIVVHAAAMKQVPACEYNPVEAVLTNVMGARNVIEAALDTGVQKVMALSTDKAVNPINLYGATKLTAEKLFVQANSYSGGGNPRFSCVRWGNVVGSRGSVVPLFLEQRENNHVTVTDLRMSRFWITLDQSVRFAIECIDLMHGGEVFVPKIPSTNIEDLVGAIAHDCEVEHVGIRPGEKLFEVLISSDEARHTVELENMYVVQPAQPWWTTTSYDDGKPLPDGFHYSSDTNPQRLSVDELRTVIECE